MAMICDESDKNNASRTPRTPSITNTFAEKQLRPGVLVQRDPLQSCVAERVLQQILGQCRAVQHDKRAVAARRTAMN